MSADLSILEPAPGGLRGLLSGVGDRLNPILVKEVRQALRGKYFRFSFWGTLALLTIVATSFLVGGRTFPDGLGIRFFMWVFTCLAIGVHFLVPFSAFVSMGAEWEENTYDLLVLSNLRPRHLVLGKFMSVLVQASLFYAAATPFLAFAFLLRDVDLLSILVVLLGSLAFCCTQTLLALFLSSLTQNKFGRVVLMAILAAILAASMAAALSMAWAILFRPSVVREPEFLPVSMGLLTGLSVLGAFFIAVGCARLAHPEENRSTGLRLLTVFGLVAGLGWFTWLYAQFPDDEPLFACGVIVAVFLFWTTLFFNTEPEALGRRVRPRVPRNAALAFLVTPLLPGGGRGFLLFCLLAPIWILMLPAVWGLDSSPNRADLTSSMQASFLSIALACSYACLLAGLFSRFTKGLYGRTLLRVLTIAGVVLSWVLPALVGFFISDRAMMQMRHLFSPFYLLEKIARDNIHDVMWMLVVQYVLAGLVLLLNVPRTVRGVIEVQRASAAARLRHAESVQ